jgi:NAD+ synthase (glutamine-hydrolysing)
MKIALLQRNFTVGDLSGNSARLEQAVRMAAEEGAELCVASELALTGYPPLDLLRDREFLASVRQELAHLATALKGLPPLLLGVPEEEGNGVLYDAAALLRDGQVEMVYRKKLLGRAQGLDSFRYFLPGHGHGDGVVEVGGKRFGIRVGEDLDWPGAEKGVDALLVLSATPFVLEKEEECLATLVDLADSLQRPVAWVNQVGGNDGLIFPGGSLALDSNGRILGRAARFEEDVFLVELDGVAVESEPADSSTEYSEEEDIWKALVLGTRDYVHKCGFPRVLLGLSGGIDSALTAAIAVEALGPDNVLGVLLPSPYTSQESEDDARALAVNLGIRAMALPIRGVMNVMDVTLAPSFVGREPDVTEENLQARIRGALLMSLSNKFHSLLLATGNKSELAVGYCTLYGDMTGGLAVLADLYKTRVYALSRWLNEERGEVIPQSTIDKAPTAELRPDQTDQDTLPPYEILDEILELRLERGKGLEDMAALEIDRETAAQVLRMLRVSEFKRRQAPLGLVLTRAPLSSLHVPVAGA